MKKHSYGFTVTELLLAVSISGMVIGLTTHLIYSFFSEQKNLEVWSSGHLEMSSALRMIEGDLRNVVRLEPMENLTADKLSFYFGVTSISPELTPSICLNNPKASVIRYTTLNRKQRSERTLRSWSEEEDVNQVGKAHELRVTADATSASMFGYNRSPREIVIVDADRRGIRRYLTSGSYMYLGSNLDPYDDQPKVDALGLPIIFPYAATNLKSSLSAIGAGVYQSASVMITGSEVYASDTYMICLRGSDGSLIRYNENTKEQDVLLQNSNADFTIESFEVGYLATRPMTRVEPGNFQADMLALPNPACVDSILLTITLKGSDAYIRRNAEQNVGDIKANISRNRIVYSQNLHEKRPLLCNK